ncbi:SMR family transporter [Pseudonocardia acidicola]|uniref:Multidrug efflux SMR transporter n=1 Tax=Pseudonocardia acidicola TaxID=2724939 RepID=A0ABX1S8A4_9PSEU|nr:multidrug efflux SMR transporter [Pseudonocardia acidicola]
MAWVFVVLGGFFETAFAVSLKYSEGFRRLWPTVSFVACAVISFAFLTAGLRDLPVGTAYAAWTGVGAVGTALAGMIWFGDPAEFVRVASVLLIVAGVVGLNLTGSSAH